MFEGFQERGDPAQRRRLAASGTLTLAALSAGTAALIAMAATDVPQQVAKKVQVAFRPPPPPVVEEAPPPPPPPRAPPPKLPKNVKVVEVEGLPPPAPLVAPAEVPQETLAEAEPTGEPVVLAVAPGSGGGDFGGATTAAEPSTPRRPEPIHLPDSAAPPRPLASNRPPEYPEESRASGREGLVILKIIVDVEGRVTVVSVLRGEEPFASAAIRAVQTWRYRPATLDGSPISIYRTLKLPFRIRS
jgi:protein TonB